MQPGDGSNQDYWQEDDDRLSAQAAPHPDDDRDDAHMQPLTWQASEAIHHEKHAMWFAGVIVAAVILLAISVFLIRSITFSILIVIMAAAAMVIGSRPPRVMNYSLSDRGLQVNEKTFSLHEFRAFGVIQDGPLYSVVLIPNKRFMPSVNVYFPQESGEQIVDIFGQRLPMEHVEPDLIDKLSRKLHF
jgi:hypothetical protein